MTLKKLDFSSNDLKKKLDFSFNTACTNTQKKKWRQKWTVDYHFCMRSCLSAYFSRRWEWTLSSMRIGCRTKHMARRVYILSLFLEICHTIENNISIYSHKNHKTIVTKTVKSQANTWKSRQVFREQHFSDSIKCVRPQPSSLANSEISASVFIIIVHLLVVAFRSLLKLEGSPSTTGWNGCVCNYFPTYSCAKPCTIQASVLLLRRCSLKVECTGKNGRSEIIVCLRSCKKFLLPVPGTVNTKIRSGPGTVNTKNRSGPGTVTRNGNYKS